MRSLLHTILNEYDVFGDVGAPLEAQMVALEGNSFLEVESFGGEARVRRLVSTDPRKYLDVRYQPGSSFYPG